MAIFGSVVLVLSIIVAIVFSVLVLVTGKGDAMSGGGSVRTTYKGKATFDDIMSRATLIMGISFMALVLVYNVVMSRLNKTEVLSTSTPISAPDSNKPSEKPDGNLPKTNVPSLPTGVDANKPLVPTPAPNAAGTTTGTTPSIPSTTPTPSTGANNAPK